MNMSDRGGRYRSIRMLLAGGSALATVMVLGSQAGYALTATAEDLAALNDPAAVMPSVSVSLVPVAWAAPDATSVNCGDMAASDGWGAGRYQELAAVGGIDPAIGADMAPVPSFAQLTAIGAADPAAKPAETKSAAIAVPAAGEPEPVVATPRAQRVREFEELAAIDSAELDSMRGGFDFGGMTVRFGFEVINTLNNVVVDKFTMPLTNIGSDPIVITHLQNVQGGTQQTQTSETLTSFTNGALVDRVFNNGQTRMAFSLKDGVMSLVQNSANNQSIQSLANVNLNVTGLTAQLRNAVMNVRALDALRGANRFRR